MELIVDEWFALPRLGTSLFTKLVREANLQYDRSRGFKADARADLSLVASLLEAALSEKVEIVLRCFVCANRVECGTCTYRGVCDRRRVSSKCICDACRGGEKSYEFYVRQFTTLWESPSSRRVRLK